MSRKRDYHVVPNSDRGGWDLRREGADRASGHFDRKSEAMDRGRDLAREREPNWSNTVATAEFKIATAMATIQIHPEIENADAPAYWP